MGRMLDHVSFGVANLERSASFYDSVLGCLGFVRAWSAPDAIGYAPKGQDDKFAIKVHSQSTPPGPGHHLAFTAPDRKSVLAFHEAALKNAGTDNGPPGLRPQYGPTYFAAFAIDPDGNRIEAVCHLA